MSRYRVKDYTISGQVITLPKDTTIEDIRLIVNETQNIVICSSMQKYEMELEIGGVDTVVANPIVVSGKTISVNTQVCTLASTDKLTIEVDYGDSTNDVLDRLGGKIDALGDLKNMYSVRFEKNDDGEDTYTMVLPIVAGIAENGDGSITLEL